MVSRVSTCCKTSDPSNLSVHAAGIHTFTPVSPSGDPVLLRRVVRQEPSWAHRDPLVKLVCRGEAGGHLVLHQGRRYVRGWCRPPKHLSPPSVYTHESVEDGTLCGLLSQLVIKEEIGFLTQLDFGDDMLVGLRDPGRQARELMREP